jgi:hypothetical protein
LISKFLSSEKSAIKELSSKDKKETYRVLIPVSEVEKENFPSKFVVAPS